MARSAEEGSTAGLDCLDLGEVQRSAAESQRELVAVKVLALRRLDGAKGGARGETESLAERAVLLGAIAVGAEAVVRVAAGGDGAKGAGEGVCGGSLGVRLGGVVNLSYGDRTMLARRS